MKNKITTHHDLLLYETPRIAGFISNNWLQKLLATYLVWKVNRKLKLYERRLEVFEFMKSRK